MLARIWAWIKRQWHKFWDWVHGRKLRRITQSVKGTRIVPMAMAARDAGKLPRPVQKLEQMQAKLSGSKYELKRRGGGLYLAEFHWKGMKFYSHGGTPGIAVRNLLNRIEALDND